MQVTFTENQYFSAQKQEHKNLNSQSFSQPIITLDIEMESGKAKAWICFVYMRKYRWIG